MTRKIVFRPQAVAEVHARNWYDEQHPGLGIRFTDAIDEVMARVASNAEAFPLVHGEIRRAVLRQFPYGIFFRVHGNDVVVMGMVHGRRHPNQWISRS